MDFLGDCLGACCAVFCLCCTPSLQNWCLFKSCGSGSSSSSGCCTSCCKKSFDDDEFENEVVRMHQKEAERERERSQSQSHSHSQSRTLNGTHSRDASSKGEEMTGSSRTAVVSEQPSGEKQMAPPRRSAEEAPGAERPKQTTRNADSNAKTEQWLQSQRTLSPDGGRAEPQP